MLNRRGWRVERADRKDTNVAEELLSRSDLPTDGLAETELWFARTGSGEVVGVAGLETWGRQGLLRSVVVDRDHRGSGVGRDVVERVLEEAGRKGLTEVYLITETAPHFFERFGFEPVDRRSVKGGVLSSVEFRGACPETAPVMRLSL